MKYRSSKKQRCGKHKHADKVKCRQPVCILCHVKFKDIALFEYHLRSNEHKLNDAPLAFILQRVEQSNVTDGPPEYRILRRKAITGQPEESQDQGQALDLSSVRIGAECISRVQVSFCGVCKIYIPEEEDNEGVNAHLRSVEHLMKLDAAK